MIFCGERGRRKIGKIEKHVCQANEFCGRQLSVRKEEEEKRRTK